MSNEIACPNCNQSDTVQHSKTAGIPAPIKPSDAPRTFIKVIRWIFGGAFTLAITMFCVFIGGSLLLGGVLGTQDSTGLSSVLLGASFLPLLCIVPIFLLFFGGFMIGLPWLIYRYVDQNYQQKYALWQRANDKYNRLQYCSRCAGVFIKGQNRIVPIEQMQAFLYEMQDARPSSMGGW
jgi:Zn-dependent protease with chaperone function